MTWGFLPVLVSMLLAEFAPPGMAIYTGAALGIGLSVYTLLRKRACLPHILLYGTSALLTLLAVMHFFHAASSPVEWYSLTLEASTLLLTGVFYLNRRPLTALYAARQKKHPTSAESLEATIVSARVTLIFGLLHLLILLPGHAPLRGESDFFLHHVLPPAVFALSILSNQIAICYFNRLMKRTIFVPIVNAEGEVTGKAPALDALSRKQEYMIPFVRVAVTLNGMLYLCPRPCGDTPEGGKTDLPVEGHLLYGESLRQGVCRLVRQALPEAPTQELKFNFKYRQDNNAAPRLVYVFTLTIDHENQLNKQEGRPGKLWTISQIEQNLGQDYFYSCFENEYNRVFSMMDEAPPTTLIDKAGKCREF